MRHTAGVRDYGLCLCYPIWGVFQPPALPVPTSRRCVRSKAPSFCLLGPGLLLFKLRIQHCRGGLEGASGLAFSEFLQQHVLGPLRMGATHVDTGEPMGNDATFYEVEDRRYKKTFRVDNTNKLPSGGFCSWSARLPCCRCWCPHAKWANYRTTLPSWSNAGSMRLASRAA